MFKKKYSREGAVFLIAIFTITQMFCLTPGIASADTTWETVGNPGFSAVTPNGAYMTKIALDSNDTPYVVFMDSANFNMATAMKFDGSTWVTVGEAGFSNGSAYHIAIAIDSNDIPYVAYRDSGSGNKATVMKFDGTDWVAVGNTGFSAGQANYIAIAMDSNDIPYVVFQDGANLNQATVMKLNGPGWEIVGDAAFSAGKADFTSIAIDSNDIPYVVFKDWGLAQKASVKKFNGTSWESVGESGCSEDQAGYTAIAIDSSDVPYFVFRDNAHGSKATALKYNGTSWDIVGEAGFSAGDVADLSLAFSNSDILYVGYIDSSYSKKATVMKFNGTSWTTVGEPGFSEGEAGYTFMSLDSNGNPYMVYRDYAYAYRATVMRYISFLSDAETPNVVTQPADSTVTVGEAVYLAVEANVAAGDLSYQWYSNTTDSNSGGSTISGATNSSYSPPTADAGTTYYYCVVTNTDDTATGNTTATVSSNAAEVVVTGSSTPADLRITTTSLPDGKVNRSYSTTLDASGGTDPYSWIVTGLPDGLDVNTVTGEVYGIPGSAGTSTVDATVYDSLSDWDFASFTLTVGRASSGSSGSSSSSSAPLEITTTSLPEATAGQFYEQTVSASGGTTPYTWSAAGLPAGLSLSPDGIISGTPAGEEAAAVMLKVSDSRNRSKSKTLTLNVNPAPPVQPPEVVLTDIAGHWAENNIKYIVAQGIVGGYPDNTFRPDQKITRAEFVTMLVKAFKLEQKSNPGFADISGHWAADDIKTAAFYGIVDGYDSGLFQPDDYITREQLAVMVVRVLKLIVIDEETTFADRGSISPWASSAVAAAVKHNLITGYPDNTFRPSGFTTRAEAATIIYNALQQK